MQMLINASFIALMILGFGFVVFFHELGHFLAAKWVGIKVEQFAVGFGHAVASWRKGLGFTWGSSGKKLAELEKAGHDISQYGETEYRINWMPLGGYVKMLGQDDLNPTATSDDPRSFNRKSVRARMLVVSAGVIMNVILAAIGFMIVFLVGFRVAPAMIGPVQSYSPAAKAGLQVGDRDDKIDDDVQADYTKMVLNIALAHPDEPLDMEINRNGHILHMKVKPEPDAHDFLGLGCERMFDLRGIDPKKAKVEDDAKIDLKTQLIPGDIITSIKGQGDAEPIAVNATNYAVFDAKLQTGRPVELAVENPQRGSRTVTTQPVMTQAFGDAKLSLAGMEPAIEILGISENSSAKGKLQPGDVVLGMWARSSRDLPTMSQLREFTSSAGKNDLKLDVRVLRNGEEVNIHGIDTVKIDRKTRGLGIAPGYAESYPVVADVIDGSPAQQAGLSKGAKIIAIDGQKVSGWRQMHEILRAKPGTHKLMFQTKSAQNMPSTQPAVFQTADLVVDEQQIADMGLIRYACGLQFDERIEPRKTNNPLTAAAWGVTETRDLLRQFYLTLRRVTQGSVSVKNFMGPIGIVYSGSQFALKGTDWLIWFLAMISANLAVVNFLPIPVVDGGLFLFLIIEKIQGRPLSARTQTVAQIVGLALIISIFLLVTYQDIGRFFMS